ncbi:hypothetical protein [Methanogenium cariaci]|nr:hypothetical protein [Methanogenium cariaci]
MTVAESMSDLNSVTAAVASAGGAVRRIDSRYPPSLEEMLLMIGK